jgi:beta-mannanase
MIAAGFGYSVIRLGAEMNGTWEIGSLGDNKTKWQQWGKCFAQEVTAMRSFPSAHFLFDWNVNARHRDIPLADYYPGNAYVDIVGISLYDEGSRLPPVGSPARWKALASEPMGLNEVYAFAAKHHKPLSVPEWGTVIRQGDDGNYVANVGDFVASHDVAYQSWFNAGNGNVYPLNPTAAPNSVAAYIRTISRRIAGSAAR